MLLTHPVSRIRVITEKLAALLAQITAMNLVVYALSLLSIAAVGEAIPWKALTLLHAIDEALRGDGAAENGAKKIEKNS